MTELSPPLWLLAELTYRCPLQCPYCSNPLALGKGKQELRTEEWFRVFEEARELGALQIGFSGGEPFLREDLVDLVDKARKLGYYTNLITSGVGSSKEAFVKLQDVGLDNIQISFESYRRETDKLITGSSKSYDQKVTAAKQVKDLGFPLGLNCVIHRQNIDQIEEIIGFAYELKADYLELANTQYHGWALKNIEHLLPTKEQLDNAEAVANRCKEKYKEMDIIFVVPDYYEVRPKPCMQGLGTIFLAVDPNGNALPCHNAKTLPLEFPNVKEHSLRYVWEESEAFNHFRGDKWMKEPCKHCPEKYIDYGGCRCQAYAITGDMYAADPICDLSPQHHKILDAIQNIHNKQAKGQLAYRNLKNASPTAT